MRKTDRQQKALQNLLPAAIPAEIPFSTGQVLPRYDGFSIANIPNSLCNWLGCPLPNGQPLDAGLTQALQAQYQHVLSPLFDGADLLTASDDPPASHPPLISTPIFPFA